MTLFKWTAHDCPLHICQTKKSRATRFFKFGPLPDFWTFSLTSFPFYATSLRSSVLLTVPLKVPSCSKMMFAFMPLHLSGMIFSSRLFTYHFPKPNSFVISGRRDSMILFLLSFLHVKCSSIISLILLDGSFTFIWLSLPLTYELSRHMHNILFWYSAVPWEISQCLLDWFESQCSRCSRRLS